MMRGSTFQSLVAVGALLALTACSGEQQELPEWIAQQREEVQQVVMCRQV